MWCCYTLQVVSYETAAAIPVDFDLTGRVFLVHPVGVLLETSPEIMQAMEELDCEGALKNMGHMTSGVTLRVCVVDAMPTNVGNKMPSL